MHRNLALALLPPDAPAHLPTLMARIIISHGTDGDRPIAILQAAGFTGAEIAAHLDAANGLVDAAFDRSARPGPHIGNLSRALAAVMTASPELTGAR